MDRSILEGNPNSIIEAMAIAGYAIGDDEENVYIRAEYPLAINRLKLAIEQAIQIGLLGENILGTNFNFHIKLKYGARAFVCGEETALIHSIQGNRGEPTTNPPFPAVSGGIKNRRKFKAGKTAPNQVLSTIKYFMHEYESHIKEKHCPASYINGKVKEKHVIDQTKCIKCGACQSNCPVNAIIKK